MINRRVKQSKKRARERVEDEEDDEREVFTKPKKEPEPVSLKMQDINYWKKKFVFF